MHLAATMLAARRLIERERPAALDWSEAIWRQWLGSERTTGTRPALIPNLIAVAALTSIDDLRLHLALMQLLSVPAIRCRVVLTLPSSQSVALARAQALRAGWEGLVAIWSEDDWLKKSSELPPEQMLAMFAVPAVLSRHRLAAAVNTLKNPVGQAEGHGRTNDIFIGRAGGGRVWIEGRKKELSETLSRLLEIELADVAGHCGAEVGSGATSPENLSAEIRRSSIMISRLRHGDEFRISTSGDARTSETLVRLGGTLHEGAERINVRLPPTYATVESRRIGLHLDSADGRNFSTAIAMHIPPQDLQPWMLSAYLNRGGGGNSVIQAFAAGIGCRIAYAEDEAVPLRDVPVVWGVLRHSDRILEQARRQSLYFFYVDHAYFERGHGRNYRVTRNRYEAGPVRACPSDRFDALGIDVHPWKNGGREILVCPPTDFFMQAHGCPDWLDKTLATLSKITDRPVRIREKPLPGESAVPLSQDLATAHALVTHSSNVAIESVCLGTPVFVSPSSAAAPVGLTDLRSIEKPICPDRSAWLAHLAYNQFSLEEICDGRAWRMLRELEVRELA